MLELQVNLVLDISADHRTAPPAGKSRTSRSNTRLLQYSFHLPFGWREERAFASMTIGEGIMIIPLRSTELAKRIAVDFEKKYHLQGERALTLDIVASQYGYPSWSKMVASVDLNAPDFVFDQDLDEPEFAFRRVEQGMAIVALTGGYYLLPEAIHMASCLGATSNQTMPIRRLHSGDKIYESAMLEERDCYWPGSNTMEHPLAPPGFDQITLSPVSMLAKLRLGGEYDRTKNVFALQPWNHVGRMHFLHSSSYYRRNELLLVEMPVWGFALDGTKAPDVTRQDLWSELYQSADEATKAVLSARADYKALLDAVKRMGLHCKRGQQPQLAARRELGKPWYWPLKPVIETEEHRKAWEMAQFIPQQLLQETAWRRQPSRSGIGLRDLDK